jgi:hypothetical protein
MSAYAVLWGEMVLGCEMVSFFLPSAVGRSPGDFGAFVGVDPGEGSEGCPLLPGAKDAYCIAGFEGQVCSWVGDHLVPPHDGQDGRPGLAPYAEVPYSMTDEATPGWTLFHPGDSSLSEPYPLYFDGL